MSLSALNVPVFYLDAGLALLATGVYTVTRPAASTYSSGVEVPDASPTTFQVQAVVNPVTGIELFRLPEGRRTTDFREVFVSVALNSESDANSADLVSIDGINFEVDRSERWNSLANTWRCIVQRSARMNPT